MALNQHQLARKYPYPILSTGNLVDTFRTGKGSNLERPDNKNLAVGWDARDSLRGQFVQLFQAIDRIKQDATITPGAQAVEIGKHARQRMEDGLTVADVAKQTLEGMRDSVVTRVEITLRPPDSYMAALLPELRAHLRSLSETKRYDLVAKGTQSPDALVFLHAIAGAPPALTGLAPGKHAEMRDALLALKDPSLLGLEDAFDRELQLLERVAQRFEEQIRDHVDFDTADAWGKLAERSV